MTARERRERHWWRRWRYWAVPLATAGAAAGLLGSTAALPTPTVTTAPVSTITTTATTTPPTTTTAATVSGCQARDGGALPDPVCTPGALNPAVTQATIAQTICVTGWTSTVRPPAAVTATEKLASMRAYGDTGTTADYEYDHLIPLELGGATNQTLNLWPEPRNIPQGAASKDATENRLKAEVCAGTITLAQAQQAIAADWRTAP